MTKGQRWLLSVTKLNRIGTRLLQPRRSSVSSKNNWPKRKDLVEAKAKFTRFSSELDHAQGGRAGSG